LLKAFLPMFLSMRNFSSYFRDRLSVTLPSSCALCGLISDDTICKACHALFFSEHPVRCPQCANALPYSLADSIEICGNCLKNPPAFDATVVATDYIAPVDQLVLALKFGGQLALAPQFARLLLDECRRSQITPLPSLLTSVPLGSQRLAERGFNQAHEIAHPIANALGIALAPQLAIRVRDTVAQSSLPNNERRKNIRKAFAVSRDAIDRISGTHIGIVDDVMTTGETLNELATTLKRAGAVRVTNLVFARSPL
jgi:ComF family protein